MKNRFAQFVSLTAFAALAALAGAAPRSFTVAVSGSGEPLILIPGLACPGAVWDETVARYEERFECHVLSIAGFGSRSTYDFGTSFLDTVATDLSAYIVERGLNKPILMGHSLGGFLALQHAIRQPEQAGPLIIVDGLPFLPAAMNPAATVESAQAMAAQQRDGMKAGGMSPAAAKQMLAMMITAPDAIERAAAWTLASEPAIVGQAMYELNTTDLRQDVSKIQSHTLVLGAWIAYQQFGSTRDSTAAIFNDQYAALPNYRLELSDKGRHFLMWDDPEFFFAQVDGFLAENPTR